MGIAVSGHVRQQLCRCTRGDVGAQRPRRIRVAHAPEQVGHVFEHVRLVDETLGGIDLFAVHADRGPAQRLQLQARGGDDDVGVEMPAGLERDTGGVEMVDVVGDHVGAAGADGVVEVGVGDQAHPLIPGVVARLEVDVDGVPGGQAADRLAPQQRPHQVRRLAGRRRRTPPRSTRCTSGSPDERACAATPFGQRRRPCRIWTPR